MKRYQKNNAKKSEYYENLNKCKNKKKIAKKN